MFSPPQKIQYLFFSVNQPHINIYNFYKKLLGQSSARMRSGKKSAVGISIVVEEGNQKKADGGNSKNIKE
uniref:Uncharacterized protein n=1 Tax=Panagrolaimus sp. ES5 TaxID=591445 RepID=A0AC34F2I2_9BILA